MADLLLDDIAHLLPRLQGQASPARGPDAAGFDHASARRHGDDPAAPVT
jgi:hypothetical protein